ncbi:DNA primase family protein [Acidithiobacillus concretivorus]|uniref:SF3 helicase domain-containing protein n=1 Tax=Acidithiobacillus concretivorus TaxID=3063952 RepID=A0ABS5ZT78_9PROT|nr:phage/plasmid primase, P4 family [Acidithiobacillus concretivorus]MBU2739870.1 hypothetical protein [Acidithiobacillus concretivorus]
MSVIPLPTAKPAEKDSTPDHTELAGYIGERAKFISNRGDFWAYSEDAGIWQVVPTEMIHRRIQDVCRQFGIAANSSRITGTEKMAHAVHYKDVKWDASNPRDVAVQNGVLKPHGEGWELQPYSLEDYRRVSLPITFDPDARCPRFTQFVQEVFAEAEDAKERTLALMEMVGLTLTASTEFERAVMLVGSGANGKSVMLRLLADMLGEYAVGINPAEFDNKFQRASLDGKLANIVTELPEGTTLPDGAIKAIISGESCTVEHKHRDPFVMKPIAKVWLGTNHLPSTRDFSPALFRRFMILGFPNTFPESKRDVRLSEKLRAEIPGILNIALAALAQAFNRGYLTTPPSSADDVSTWKRDADQVASFADETLIIEPGSRIASGEAYGLYREWAIESGIQRLVNRKSFTTRIEGLGLAQAGRGTGGERFLFGIRQRLAGDL